MAAIAASTVRVASTANVNIATGTLLTIDGITLVVGDRVLLKNQSVASQNGVYVAANGAWSRSDDLNTSAEMIPGTKIYVETGTTQGGTNWELSTPNPITLGTTDLIFINREDYLVKDSEVPNFYSGNLDVPGNLTVNGAITSIGGLNVTNLHADELTLQCQLNESDSIIYPTMAKPADISSGVYVPQYNSGFSYNASTGELTVPNLKVTGATTTIDTVNLSVKDNEIILNSDESPANFTVSAGTAGISVNRGSGAAAKVQYDEIGGNVWRIGLTGSLQAVATRADAPNNNSLQYWLDSSKRLESLSYGNAGQVLVSGGSNVLPSWLDATNANTASTIVKRDASGNFSAGTVTAALAGNASTATTLQTARTIGISGKITGTATSFNGGANITIATTAASILSSEVSDATNANTANKIVKRDASGNFSAGTITANLSGNASTATSAVNLSAGTTMSIPYQTASGATAYLPAGTGVLQSNGTGSAPTWVTGISAGSAAQLATARNIAGVSFDGTSDISIPFANLTSKPTTVSGYGITDAITTANIGSQTCYAKYKA